MLPTRIKLIVCFVSIMDRLACSTYPCPTEGTPLSTYQDFSCNVMRVVKGHTCLHRIAHRLCRPRSRQLCLVSLASCILRGSSTLSWSPRLLLNVAPTNQLETTYSEAGSHHHKIVHLRARAREAGNDLGHLTDDACHVAVSGDVFEVLSEVLLESYCEDAMQGFR